MSDAPRGIPKDVLLYVEKRDGTVEVIRNPVVAAKRWMRDSMDRLIRLLSSITFG